MLCCVRLSKKWLFLLLCFMFFQEGMTQKPPKRAKWKALGPFEVPTSNVDSGRWSAVGIGWVESFWVDPLLKKWYVGSIAGGIYSSRNNGHRWKSLNNYGQIQGVLDIDFYKEELFIACGVTHLAKENGTGIWISSDNGKNWRKSGLQFEPHHQTIVWRMARVDDTLMAVTQKEIYRSTDNGLNFEKIWEGDKSINFRHLVSSKHRKELMFASGANLLVSQDYGKTFLDITDRLHGKLTNDEHRIIRRLALSEDPNIPGRWLVLYQFGGHTIIEETKDDGANWEIMYKAGYFNRFDVHHNEIAIAPNNSGVVLIGGVRCFLSLDSGRRFTQITNPNYQNPQFVHDDIRSMKVLNENTFVLGHDGGISITFDQGAKWWDLSGKDLNLTMAIGLGIADDGDTYYVGYQDLGVMKYEGKKWIHLGEIYGDGGDNISKDDHLLFFRNGRLQQMEKLNYKNTKGIGTSGVFNHYYSRIFFHPETKDTFYVVNNHLSKYNGKQWEILTKDLDTRGMKLSTAHVAEGNSNVMYFAFEEPTWKSSVLSGKFFKSIDGGVSFEDITANLSILIWRHITHITTNPANPDEIYLSMGTIDENEINKCFRSLDGGKTWENFSQGLGPYDTFKIMFLPGSKSGLILSSQDGMFYRNAKLAAWIPLQNRMPSICVYDFEYVPKKRTLVAATYGNGLYEMKMPKRMLRY